MKNLKKFPSPCGDMLFRGFDKMVVLDGSVSVPLRGYVVSPRGLRWPCGATRFRPLAGICCFRFVIV